MSLQDDFFIHKDFNVKNWFLYSLNDNFILGDNIDSINELSNDIPMFYNASFYHAIFVKKGCLRVIIDGIDVNVHENDYLVITPCTTVTYKKSKVSFFSFIFRAHIVVNVYKRLQIPFENRMGLFAFYHHRFDSDVVCEFNDLYNNMKLEAKRKPYKFIEMAMKEYVSIYIINMISLIPKYPHVEYYKQSRQRVIYLKMLELLNTYYKKNRSVAFYADKLCISSKYLSNITVHYTGLPASVVIDNFVMFNAKVMLYDGELNIKKISDLFNFQSQSFFGRYFKRNTGISPREFLRKYNKRLYLSEYLDNDE